MTCPASHCSNSSWKIGNVEVNCDNGADEVVWVFVGRREFVEPVYQAGKFVFDVKHLCEWVDDDSLRKRFLVEAHDYDLSSLGAVSVVALYANGPVIFDCVIVDPLDCLQRYSGDMERFFVVAWHCWESWQCLKVMCHFDL